MRTPAETSPGESGLAPQATAESLRELEARDLEPELERPVAVAGDQAPIGKPREREHAPTEGPRPRIWTGRLVDFQRRLDRAHHLVAALDVLAQVFSPGVHDHVGAALLFARAQQVQAGLDAGRHLRSPSAACFGRAPVQRAPPRRLDLRQHGLAHALLREAIVSPSTSEHLFLDQLEIAARRRSRDRPRLAPIPARARLRQRSNPTAALRRSAPRQLARLGRERGQPLAQSSSTRLGSSSAETSSGSTQPPSTYFAIFLRTSSCARSMH